MPLPRVDVPSLGRSPSVVMAHPSSADEATHGPGLDAYRKLGGNCLHLHCEGGETHSRRAAGEWLRERRLRPEFFLCTQICHDDEVGGSRFTAAAVAADVGRDLDDRPGEPFEPIVDALSREIARGRVRAWAGRNWPSQRLRDAAAYARGSGAPPMAAIVTTELALPLATAPLWPEYLPFDTTLRMTVLELGLTVFAHAGDLTLGQCLFGNEDSLARLRPHWVERWQHADNPALEKRIRRFSAEHGLTPREVGLAWLLHQPFPVVGIVSLPTLLDPVRRAEYERAAALQLTPDDIEFLAGRDRSRSG